MSFLEEGQTNRVCEDRRGGDGQTNQPKFWIEFRTFDDGMHTAAGRPNTAPTSFPQFTRLPTELRLKIWECLVQPRIVVACCLERDARLPERRAQLRNRTATQEKDNNNYKHSGTTGGMTSNGSCSPVLLRINHEARTVGLRFYELTFSWRISKLLSDTPVSQPARVWFNFALDGLYLTGELEAFDAYGFNSPMVYFLRPEDTGRVRYVACAFAELGYPQLESDQIFGCLWHVADRFRAAERLLVAICPGEEEAAHCKFGGSADANGETAMAQKNDVCGGGATDPLLTEEDNIMQKIWEGWMGSVRGIGKRDDRSQLADKKIVFVREESLPTVIAGGG